jgi:hypothetical protein
VGKPTGKRPLGRPRCRQVYNIKIEEIRGFQWLFTILLKLSTTCFGRTSEINRLPVMLISAYIFPLEDGHTTETCS